MTMTLSPAGRMYLLQLQAHAVRVATAKCPRCGDLLYADGQAPAQHDVAESVELDYRGFPPSVAAGAPQ